MGCLGELGVNDLVRLVGLELRRAALLSASSSSVIVGINRVLLSKSSWSLVGRSGSGRGNSAVSSSHWKNFCAVLDTWYDSSDDKVA